MYVATDLIPFLVHFSSPQKRIDVDLAYQSEAKLAKSKVFSNNKV
jgi:hypothetical protein